MNYENLIEASKLYKIFQDKFATTASLFECHDEMENWIEYCHAHDISREYSIIAYNMMKKFGDEINDAINNVFYEYMNKYSKWSEENTSRMDYQTADTIAEDLLSN